MLLNIAVANELDTACQAGEVQSQCATATKMPTKAVYDDPTPLFPEKKMWWFSDTYSPAQEQTFGQLRSEFATDPWGVCTLQTGAIPAYSYDKRLRETMPMDVYANRSELFDSDLVSFAGNIDLNRADQHAMADKLDYNKSSGVLDLYGNIIYSDTGMALHSQSARVNLLEDKSLMRDVSFVLPASPVRGSAGVVYRESATFSRFKDVTYTACAPGNQDWIVHASKMKVNDETGRVAIKNAWMEFKNVPVMYIPYGSFPVDNRRLTGLLTPTIGVSGRSGVDISMPFYWNMAPNYDLTLTPRYMSKRGFMMGTDFRYLWNNSEGQVNIEMMPEDKLTDEMRWGGSFLHKTAFMDNLNLDINANYVSDNAYFSDLDGTLGMSNRNRYLGSDAELEYTLPWMSLTARVENYQNIDPNSSDDNVPYRRLPQVKLDILKDIENLPLDIPLEVAVDSEMVYFQRHFPDGEPEAARFNFEPSVSFPFIAQSGFIVPKVAMQHTSYWVTENEDWLTGEAGSGSNYLNKTLPVISLDSGLFFERDFDFGFGGLTHTVEPRLFYLYVPYVNQDDLPDFDTSAYDFNMGQMFRDNQFNGVDKTQNANQVTAAVTTRLIGNGRDRLKLTIGQIFYFEDRKVSLAGFGQQTDTFSNLITELSSEITDELRFTSGMQWNYGESEVDRGNIELRYHGLDNHVIFNIGYRYRQGRAYQEGQNQLVASTIIPVYDGWSIIGLYRHSFEYGETLEYFYGIEKDTCCWRFRILGRQFIRSSSLASGDGVKAENSIYFQLELKGLTSLGDSLEGFLSENISGYREPVY